MNGGIGSPGLTSVAKVPSGSPPRTFTAPTSVIPRWSGTPPVVSRSRTTNVTSCSSVPISAMLSWAYAGPAGTQRTLERRYDTLEERRAHTLKIAVFRADVQSDRTFVRKIAIKAGGAGDLHPLGRC